MTHRLGYEFPYEGFVQRSIEEFFRSQGFVAAKSGYTDLVCRHPETDELWFIEAKGRTSAIGLDFRTGLGQVVQGMAVPGANYAIAVPAIPQFLAQCQRMSPWVLQALNLHWLLVAESGAVTRIDPSGSVPSA